MKTLKYITAIVLCAGLIAGCGMMQRGSETPVTAAIPQAPTFSAGTLQAAYPYPFDQTWNAALSALDSLRMPVVGQNKVAGGNITATGTDGTPINLKLTPRGAGATVVDIRVGTGNEQVSRAINSMIAGQFGMRG
jgi:hypothetical protein